MSRTDPVILSTWKHGEAANAVGWPLLCRDGSALDAVEAAVRTAEADPRVRSVGRGGYPDRLGRVTLDACIMDHRYNCGAVAALAGIVHAVSVARLVMERSDSVLLTGEGALEFALEHGFRRENLLTAETVALWQAGPAPEAHDTIATLALDSAGRLAGACTTSGRPNKAPGRVGDSPIVGAGLLVDGEAGAAAATGHGELALRTAIAAFVVGRLRSGDDPQHACEAGIEFLRSRARPGTGRQLGLIALAPDGRTGAAALLRGFVVAETRGSNGCVLRTVGG